MNASNDWKSDRTELTFWELNALRGIAAHGHDMRVDSVIGSALMRMQLVTNDFGWGQAYFYNVTPLGIRVRDLYKDVSGPLFVQDHDVFYKAGDSLVIETATTKVIVSPDGLVTVKALPSFDIQGENIAIPFMPLVVLSAIAQAQPGDTTQIPAVLVIEDAEGDALPS